MRSSLISCWGRGFTRGCLRCMYRQRAMSGVGLCVHAGWGLALRGSSLARAGDCVVCKVEVPGAQDGMPRGSREGGTLPQKIHVWGKSNKGRQGMQGGREMQRRAHRG